MFKNTPQPLNKFKVYQDRDLYSKAIINKDLILLYIPLTPSIPIGGLPLYCGGIGPPPQASRGIGGPRSPYKEYTELHTCYS